VREGEAKERRRGRVRGSRGSRRRRREGPRRRGGEGRRQAGRWRVATARACAVSLLCLLAEVEDDWHQASGLGCPLGQPGKGPGKTLSPFSNYFSFLFCRFVLNLVLKPIQFILLLTIFLGAKRIKTMLHKIFQNYWTYIYLIVDINPIQIIIALIQMPKLNVSETPKLLVWILPLANISRGYQEHFLGHI